MSDKPGHPGGDQAQRLPGSSDEGGHGSWRIYAAGFALCLLQTGLAFAVASNGLMTHESNIAAIACLAVGQVLVQLIFFVHLSTSPDAGANTAAIAYAVLVIGLFVIGSVWIMAHLNGRMMPMGELIRMQR